MRVKGAVRRLLPPELSLTLLLSPTQVGQLNPRESSYRLKEELFGQVQEDWLGYTAEERQEVRQLLRRCSPGTRGRELPWCPQS